MSNSGGDRNWADLIGSIAELVSTRVFSCCYDLPLVRERNTITSRDSITKWADLPTDLIGSIVELLSTADYLRFGAVCTSWAASVRLFIPRAPQMPFLVNPKEYCTLVDLTDGRRRRLTGFMKGKRCVGSQDGWLALIDPRSEISLFNPISRSQIQLPSIATMDGVEPVCDSSGEYYITNFEGRPRTVHGLSFIKAVAFSRPTTAGNPVAAVLFFYGSPSLFATATAAGKWIVIRDAEIMLDIINYSSSRRFLMKSMYGLWVLDVTGDSSPKLTKIMDDNLYTNTHYVFGKSVHLANCNGDVLLVVIATRKVGALDHVKVFRLENQQRWVPLRRGGLGDKSLFVGPFPSFSLSVPELKPNSVYCNWLEEGEDWPLNERRRFGWFHLDDGSVDYCSYPPLSFLDCAFLPFWFAPSLV